MKRVNRELSGQKYPDHRRRCQTGGLSRVFAECLNRLAVQPSHKGRLHRQIWQSITAGRQIPVSYTHLDVYKRQLLTYTMGMLKLTAN